MATDYGRHLVRRLEVSRVSDEYNVNAGEGVVRVPHWSPERHLPAGFAIDKYHARRGEFGDEVRRYWALAIESQFDQCGAFENGAQPLPEPGPPQNPDLDRGAESHVYG